MGTSDWRERVMRAIDFLRRRSTNYKQAFSSPVAQAVLMDLAKFCRANETCFDNDPRRHAVLEGRREVWLRIMNHLKLTPDQLYSIYQGRNFIIQETKDE